MGRNNDTFTLVIDKHRETWGKFRRGLRKEDQVLFDEMWRAPKLHLAAGAFIANEVPLETILMAMLLEQHRRIKHLENKLQVVSRVEISDCPIPLCEIETSSRSVSETGRLEEGSGDATCSAT